jgi:hypothetical protein
MREKEREYERERVRERLYWKWSKKSEGIVKSGDVSPKHVFTSLL